jgi:hypothetical protein
MFSVGLSIWSFNSAQILGASHFVLFCFHQNRPSSYAFQPVNWPTEGHLPPPFTEAVATTPQRTAAPRSTVCRPPMLSGRGNEAPLVPPPFPSWISTQVSPLPLLFDFETDGIECPLAAAVFSTRHLNSPPRPYKRHPRAPHLSLLPSLAPFYHLHAPCCFVVEPLRSWFVPPRRRPKSAFPPPPLTHGEDWQGLLFLLLQPRWAPVAGVTREQALRWALTAAPPWVHREPAPRWVHESIDSVHQIYLLKIILYSI